MEKDYMKKLDDSILEKVSGGAGEEAYDFAGIAREMVLADKGRSSRIEKTVGDYKIAVQTYFTFDADFGTYMGPYEYTVYKGETVVKTERIGDFIM